MRVDIYRMLEIAYFFFFFFQAEDGIRDIGVTGVQTCALPIFLRREEGPARDEERRQGRGAAADPHGLRARGRVVRTRSEERRVGKECRSRWGACHLKARTTKGDPHC